MTVVDLRFDPRRRVRREWLRMSARALQRSRVLPRAAFLALTLLVTLPAIGQVCKLPPGVLVEEDVMFSTAGQNVWGPTNQRPPDSTIKIFRTPWSGGIGGGYFVDFRTFGTFGASAYANSSGAIGAYLGLRSMSGGTIDVDYSTRMRFIGPWSNQFRPGQTTSVLFFGIPLLDSAITPSGDFNGGYLSLWGELDFTLSASARACAITCANFNPPELKGSSLDPGNLFPRAPGVPSFFGDRMQLVTEVPLNLQDMKLGPFWESASALFQGDCEDDQVELEEFGSTYDKTGLSGCVGFPKLPSDPGGLDQNALALHEKVPFLDLDLDIDHWASKIKGVPKLGHEQDLIPGVASVYVDGLDIDLNGVLSIEQTLRFEPRPRMTLKFPVEVPYQIINYQQCEFVRSGKGDTIDLTWGEQAFFRGPAQNFDIETTYSLPNTFSNDTDLVFDLGFVERILEAGGEVGSQLLGYEGFKICEPWPDYSCWRPGIWSPKIEKSVGPLKTFRQDLTTLRDSKLLDNNQPPWSLTGFQTFPGKKIPYDPAFLPVLVLSGVPAGPVTEGDVITIDFTGSNDPDGEPFTAGIELYRAYKLLRSIDGPTGQGSTTSFSFRLTDDTTTAPFGVSAVGLDHSPTIYETGPQRSRRFFLLQILNAPPVVSGVVDGSGVEGTEYAFTATIADPGVEDSHIVTVDWGDGTVLDVVSLPNAIVPGCDPLFDVCPPRSASFSHVYADSGAFTVQVCATDDEGAQTCESATATIANATPAVTSVASEEVAAPSGGGVQYDLQLLANFHDQGTLDTHTGRFVWDEDLSETALTIRESPFGPPGATGGQDGEMSVATSKVFTTPGAKTTQICSRDDDGDEGCVAGPTITVAEADLALSGSKTPSSAPIGDVLTLDYTVTNNGADAAENVAVVVDLPVNASSEQLTTLVSAKRSGGAGGLEQELLPFDLNNQDPNFEFGTALDLAGDTLAISAGNADPVNTDQGAVYVYQRVGDTWTDGPSFHASDGQTQDLFGSSIAVSADQSTIVVGASQAGTAGNNEGAVYVYRRIDTNGTPGDLTDDDWREEAASLRPAWATANAQVGVSVAIEGNLLVAGAFGNDTNGQTSSGAAVVYQRSDNGTPVDPTDDFWTEQAELTAQTPAQNELFGQRVAISNGRIAIVSGDGGDQASGRVTIFEQSGGAWTIAQELDGTSLSGSPAVFAYGGLALEGDRLLVSSPTGNVFPGYVQSFHFDGSSFVLDSEVLMKLASGVALDGDYAVVGSFEHMPDADGNEKSVGVARTLEWNGSEWVPEGVLVPSDAADRSDSFARDRIAVTGKSVVAATPLSPQIGQLGMGSAFVMQTCEQRPDGHIRCGLGTLTNGESRTVQILTRIGCAQAAGVDLTTTAEVDGTVIDPIPGNDVSSIVATTAQVGGLCGFDSSPPFVTPTITGTEGNNGWFTSDVGLSWQVYDPDSGIGSTTGCGSSSITTDTTGTTSTCSATNGAFYTVERSVVIRRDTTAPVVVPTPTGTPGDNGWFTSDVTVGFLCSDAGSGVQSCSSPLAVSGEGLHPGISGTGTDLAGNTTTASVDVGIDLTPPSIIATRTSPNESGWNNSDVTVQFACSDATSGIAVCPSPVTVVAEGAGQSASGLAQDNAGLTQSAQVLGINIDRTPPMVTTSSDPAATGAGWQKEPVTVTFSCSDPLSGVGLCPEPVIFDLEGAAQDDQVVAADLAGNEVTVSAGPISIDYTPPTISASVSPAPDANGLRALPVTVTFNCSDALSGVADCPAPIVLTTGGLSQSVQGVATDNAGNTAELTVGNIDAGLPVLTLSGNQSVNEGQFLGNSLASATWGALTRGVALIEWGDGHSSVVPIADDGSIDTTYAFADDGVYTVSVTVPPISSADLTGSFNVTVANRPPTIESIEFQGAASAPQIDPMLTSIGAGGELALSVAFADPGSADTHTATIDWGDGLLESVTPVESPIGPPSPGAMGGAMLGLHTYGAVGTYMGRACVMDDEGAVACTDFTVQVVPPPAPSPLTCGISFGAPVVTGTIDVPLQATVQAAGITDTAIVWEDSDNALPFDDRNSLTPVLTLPVGDHDLALSFNAQVQFANGSSDSCTAVACAMVSSGGALSPCTFPNFGSPAVIVAPSSGLLTTEGGGSDTFRLVLNTEPTADVTISLASSDLAEGMVSPASVTFTLANWTAEYVVTVTGVDDDVFDGDQPYTIITGAAVSADPNYGGMEVPDVTVTNLDDETGGVSVSPISGLLTTEAGGSDTFTIVLESTPAADVTIALSSSDESEGTVAPASVTFTPANWAEAQVVTVTGVDDVIFDGDQPYTIITGTTVSADPNYGGLEVPDVAATNLDDETPHVSVSPITGLLTSEAGGSDTFTIVLTSSPTADVTIALSSSDESEGTVAPASVTFTSADYAVPRTVTVTGVDDVLADGDQPYTIVTGDAVSADPSYGGMIVADVAVTNLDDETSPADPDGDGVPSEIENEGPNGGDGNGDGIPDAMQPTVTTLMSANGNGPITVVSTCELRDVHARLKNGLAATPIAFPFALVEFTLPCASADMTVLFHAGAGWNPRIGYWKYGPDTPGQAVTTKWYRLPGVQFDTAMVAGTQVDRARFTLNDGQLGDDTGIDGQIVDQGGPGAPGGGAANIPTLSEWMLLMMALLLASSALWRLRP